MDPIIKYVMLNGYRLELRITEPPGRLPGDMKYDTQWWVLSEDASVMVSEATAMGILISKLAEKLK